MKRRREIKDSLLTFKFTFIHLANKTSSLIKAWFAVFLIKWRGLNAGSHCLWNYTIPLDLNSNGQCSPWNYVLNVQIFIYKYWIEGNALNKKKYGKGYSFGPPQCLNHGYALAWHRALNKTNTYFMLVVDGWVEFKCFLFVFVILATKENVHYCLLCYCQCWGSYSKKVIDYTFWLLKKKGMLYFTRLLTAESN